MVAVRDHDQGRAALESGGEGRSRPRGRGRVEHRALERHAAAHHRDGARVELAPPHLEQAERGGIVGRDGGLEADAARLTAEQDLDRSVARAAVRRRVGCDGASPPRRCWAGRRAARRGRRGGGRWRPSAPARRRPPASCRAAGCARARPIRRCGPRDRRWRRVRPCPGWPRSARPGLRSGPAAGRRSWRHRRRSGRSRSRRLPRTLRPRDEERQEERRREEAGRPALSPPRSRRDAGPAASAAPRAIPRAQPRRGRRRVSPRTASLSPWTRRAGAPLLPRGRPGRDRLPWPRSTSVPGPPTRSPCTASLFASPAPPRSEPSRFDSEHGRPSREPSVRQRTNRVCTPPHRPGRVSFLGFDQAGRLSSAQEAGTRIE